MEDLRFNIHLTDDTSSSGVASPSHRPQQQSPGASSSSPSLPSSSPQGRREGPLSSRVKKAIDTTEAVAKATIELNETNLKRLRRAYEKNANAIRDTIPAGPERRDAIMDLRNTYQDTRDAIKKAESAEDALNKIDKMEGVRLAKEFNEQQKVAAGLRKERADSLLRAEEERAQRDADYNAARKADADLAKQLWSDAARGEQAQAKEVAKRQKEQGSLFSKMMDEQERAEREHAKTVASESARLLDLQQENTRIRIAEEHARFLESQRIAKENADDDSKQAKDIRKRVKALNTQGARVQREGEREAAAMRRGEAHGLRDFADQKRYANDPIYREQIDKQHAADTAAGFGRLNQVARAFPGLQPFLPAAGGVYGGVLGSAAAATSGTGFVGGAIVGSLAGAAAGQATRMVISAAGQRVGTAIGGAMGATIGAYFGPVIGAIVGSRVGRAVGGFIAKADTEVVRATVEGAGRYSPELAFARAENTVRITNQRLAAARVLGEDFKMVTESQGFNERQWEFLKNELYKSTAGLRTLVNYAEGASAWTLGEGVAILRRLADPLGVGDHLKKSLEDYDRRQRAEEGKIEGNPNLFMGIDISHLEIPGIVGNDGLIQDPHDDSQHPTRISI